MIAVKRLMLLDWARALGRAVGAGLYYFNGRMPRVVARQDVQSTGELISEMGRLWTQPWAQTAAMLEADDFGCVGEPLLSGEGVIGLGPQLVHRGRQLTGGKLVPTTPHGIADLVRSVQAGGITGILPDQVPNNENVGINAFFWCLVFHRSARAQSHQKVGRSAGNGHCAAARTRVSCGLPACRTGRSE